MRVKPDVAIRLIDLSRTQKRAIALLADFVFLIVAVWAAFAIRLGDLTGPGTKFWWLLVVAPVISIPIFIRFGLYRAVIRYLSGQAAVAVLKSVTLSTLALSVVVLLVRQQDFPRSTLILYWLLALLLVGGSRFLARNILYKANRNQVQREPVLIYGAGNAGAQLAGFLMNTPAFEPVAMVDDDRSLHGSVVRGLRVHSPKKLPELISYHGITQVLLAIPQAGRARRNEILAALAPFPVHVKTIPTLSDLLSGRARVDEVREIEIEDLLGRDPVAPDQELMERCIVDKNVLVTGAGGSIGSELCRQIIQIRPRRLVLFEVSEFGLYKIEQELQALIDTQGLAVELIPLLGSVQNRAQLLDAMLKLDIQTVYHAAAYKHVPMVEHNVSEGVCNNTLGTWYAASAAHEAGVERFVLISTDKAVRPTNVMGASKRMAELVLQALAERDTNTIFCMVRFGNVLGSSGSVVPLFRQQIRSGGPVQVTHPDMTRYFMTIPEAAALVIQAGSMGLGGDVFVLDMGEPVKIIDLARQMIHLSGFQVRNAANPNGDVQIEFSGLRPGEKLFEELLIGDNVSGTTHKRIMRAVEDNLAWQQIEDLLQRLEKAAGSFDCDAVHAILKQAVPEFNSQGPVADPLRKVAVSQARPADSQAGKVSYLPQSAER